MGIAARLAIIPQEILNIENEKLELEQSLNLTQEPMFLSFVDPVVWIHNPVVWIEEGAAERTAIAHREGCPPR
jgi:hypothetical protein